MSLYQKNQAAVTMPDVKFSDVYKNGAINVDETLRILDPSLKMFQALAVIHDVLTYIKDMEGQINNLEQQKENIIKDINKFHIERQTLASTQDKSLNQIRINHQAALDSMTNEFKKINDDLIIRKQQLTDLENKLNNQTSIILNDCEIKCKNMIKQTEDKVYDMNKKAEEAEARLIVAIKERDKLIAKLGK